MLELAYHILWWWAVCNFVLETVSYRNFVLATVSYCNFVLETVYAIVGRGVGISALCGYPLVKVPVEKMCLFAPILLRLNYFRQNIWRLSSIQFHF